MKDEEILGELKTSYELLEDIIENQYKQIESTKELETAQNVLANKYYEVYKRVEKENEKLLNYQKDIKISPYINADYIDKNGDYINAGDLNWQKWWEDLEFLTKL